MSRLHIQLDQRRWLRVRRAVFRRDNYRCQSCGRAAGRAECDHKIPLHLGGDPWKKSNLQTLCRGCHIEKTAGENSKPLSAEQRAWRAVVADLLG